MLSRLERRRRRKEQKAKLFIGSHCGECVHFSWSSKSLPARGGLVQQSHHNCGEAKQWYVPQGPACKDFVLSITYPKIAVICSYCKRGSVIFYDAELYIEDYRCTWCTKLGTLEQVDEGGE